jgi:hypothetical protein
LKTIEKIIAMSGGTDGLYVSITNEPYMRLVIENIGEGPHGLPAISVAHYFELNGDLCQDPGDVLRSRELTGWSGHEPVYVSNGQPSCLSGGVRRCTGCRTCP